MKRSATTLAGLAGLAGLALVLLSAGPAVADWGTDVDQAGIKTRLSNAEIDRAKQGLDLETGAPDPRSFEYVSVYACPFSTPGSAGADISCPGAIQACATNTPEQGQGPQVRLYRRELNASGGAIGGWTLIGTTCSPERAPGKTVLGLGPILAAFHHTPFAKPAVHIQPEGNITLVTLGTFFEVKWPEAGFQPGEVDTTTMLGYQVQIRPTVAGYTYVFGDGTSFGPTPSPGGIYPNGDITPAYPKGGSYDTHIDITYGGEFSLNGGPWLPIPDTATIAGAVQPLIVKTAHARLVAR